MSLDPLAPRCGTYWTCVEARKGGLSITTTSGSDITRFLFIRGISLPCDSTAPFQVDRPVTDIAQGWVANAPLLVPSEAAGAATLVPSVGDATGSARNDASPTFENTRDPGDSSASASLGVFPCRSEFGTFRLMPPLRDDQYISLSPTDSPEDGVETDLGAAALRPASQEGGREVGKGLTRLPAILAGGGGVVECTE